VSAASRDGARRRDCRDWHFSRCAPLEGPRASKSAAGVGAGAALLSARRENVSTRRSSPSGAIVSIEFRDTPRVGIPAAPTRSLRSTAPRTAGESATSAPTAVPRPVLRWPFRFPPALRRVLRTSRTATTAREPRAPARPGRAQRRPRTGRRALASEARDPEAPRRAPRGSPLVPTPAHSHRRTRSRRTCTSRAPPWVPSPAPRRSPARRLSPSR